MTAVTRYSYAEQKRYKEAAEILEIATLKSNVNPRIFYNLGIIYQYLNDHKKAETSLLKAYNISKNEFDVIYALADFYVKRQDYKSAIKYSEELKTLFPTNPAGAQLLNFINDQMKREN